MKFYIKKNYSRYLHSSLITFLSILVPMLLVVKDNINIDTLNMTSLIALGGVVIRSVFKATWETFWVYILKLNIYLKQKYGK